MLIGVIFIPQSSRSANVHELVLNFHHQIPVASSQEDKQRMEREAMQNMCAELGSAAAQQLMDLWEEYEAGSSPEAVLLKV